MIISEEQARRAARYRLTQDEHATGTPHADVPPEVLELARKAASSAPDIRADRIEEARTRLDAGEFDAHDIANKMLSRIVSDSLR